MKRLKDNRSIILAFLLIIFTLGIYSIFIIRYTAKDTNIACKEDGKKTRGAFIYFLLTLFTLGLYAIIWEYNLLRRWQTLTDNNGEQPILSPKTYLLIAIILYATGTGAVIFLGLRIKGLNQICSLYNETIPEEKIDPSKNNWGWKFN